MNTELVPISDLTPDPANARKHGERNLKAIIDSLRAFGQQKPIVVDRRGVVVAGNGTLEAAKRLGWDEIAIVRTELDATQATAYGIADNRTAELAEWDSEVLTSLMDSLDDEMRELLAFSEEEIGAFSIDSVPLPELNSDEEKLIRQMTFTVHEEQHEQIEQAIKRAKENGGGTSEINSNSNGNALAWICRKFSNE